ncbi:MAG: DUF1801 domain-containing protein [Anaerolineae bacterium]
MSDLKTKPQANDPYAYLEQIEPEQKREDSLAILRLMEDVTGEPPVMWGDSMIGFGSYHYTYASGREGDWFLTGFAPRKKNLVLYIMAGFDEYDNLMERLGKHKTGKACLYVNKLADIDLDVLRELVAQSVEHMKQTND